MFDKINIVIIVKSHLATLKDAKLGRAGWADYFIFLVTPILVAVLLCSFQIFLDKDSVAILNSVLALFVGLFFNIIVLIFDMISRDERNNYDIKLLRELIQNISFIILLSLICIVLAFISLAENIIIKYISNFITYVLCILFTVTVLMILKRMYIFFDEEITKKLHKPRKLE